MPQRTSGLQALAVVLLGVVPLAALLAAHYFIYRPGRKAYLQQRSYRALATVSQQLAARLGGIDASLQHPQFDVPRECDLPRPSPNLEFICSFPIDGAGKPESNPRGYVTPTSEATFIYYVYEYPSQTPHALPAAAVVPAPDQTQRGAAPARECKFARDATICGRANLDAMMDPLVGGDEFDDVLLVRAGEVVYQRAATRTGNVPTLAALMEQAADQGARATPGTGQGEANKNPPAPRVSYSKPISVEYLGDRYFLYFQRISVPPSLQVGAAGGAPAEWLLCGLVRENRLDWEAGALPGSLLALLLFLLLMALLAWPLLKLWFMGPRERLRAINVYLLAFACLLASALLTGFVLYTSLQLRFSDTIDDELRRIANQVEERFDGEIKSAYRQLICFNRTYDRAQAPEKLADGHAGRSTCAVPNIRAWLYPYFKQLLWVNEKGEPYLAWTPTASDDPTQPPRAWWITPMEPPPLELRDRPYFKDVQRGRLWELGSEAFACDQGCSCPGDARPTDGLPDGEETGCSEDEASRDGSIRFAIQPVRSRIDGENTVVLAVAIWDTVDPQVALIATPLLSLIGPVVAPGFGFAVLDDTGTVLFHSDATHNLQENFFQESEDARALNAAVHARRAEYVVGAYAAKSHRLYTAPLQNTPWSVVVFYDREFVDTMHIGVAEAWLAMFGLYVAMCVVGGLGLQLWRRRYRAEWLWPDPARGALYWQAALLLLLTTATATVVVHRGDALARATLVMALPPLTLALLYLHLNRGRHLAVWQRAVALLIAVVAGTVLLGCASDRYGGLAVVLTACAWGASGLSHRGGGGRRAFQAAYVSMLFLWLVVLAVFPAAVFFMDAYQGGTIALVKLGQLRFAQSLVQRANRLRNDYRQRALASWALDERLQDRRDVYDARLFVESSSLTGIADPAVDAGGGNSCLPVDAKRCPLTSFLWANLVCPPATEDNDLVRALQYHVSSIVMRGLPAHNDRAGLLSQMAYDRASDGRWAWRWMDDGLRELRLSLCDDRIDAAGRVGRGAAGPANGHLWVQASVASILSPGGADWWLIAVVALIAGVLVFRLLWSIADHVFLWGLQWPEPTGLPKIDPQGYEAIWEQCSEEERLTLAQLAQEGFLNPNNVGVIGSLAQRQLIRRAPAFRLPRAFREVVLRHASRQQMAAWERHGERSSWSKVQTPVLMIIILGVAFLWLTQPGLLNATTGTIASITAALPLVLRLLGRSPEEKSDKPAAEKAEKQGAKG